MKTFIVFLTIFLSGCATIERFIDDVYDGDPRMSEIKADIDALKGKLHDIRDDLRAKAETRLNILREEAEMLGDLKKAEFETKLGEMREQLNAVREVIR